MRNLKVLIWLFGNEVEPLNRTFEALHAHYGIESFDIAGVLGEGKLFVQGQAISNVPFDKVPNVAVDYVIVAGLNPTNISDGDALRKMLAEQIQMPGVSVVFDFELFNGMFSLPKVCLVVIFNHRFDRNLPALRKIYGGRFSNVRFLMPFYDGTDDDVIPVYEASYQFQGYLIQAYEKLKSIPCTHYLFIGDDLIIHPDFDETNFVARSNMYGKKFLTAKITPLNSPNRFKWYWTINSSKPFYDGVTSWRGSLYTYEEAMSKFNEFFGARYKETYDEAFFGNPNEPCWTVLGNWSDTKGFANAVNYFIASNGNTLHIPYPMASGYSDIFCVDRESLFKLSRLCGVFSAMNMFIEIAIPTAAVLTYKRDDVIFFPQSSLLILWGKDRETFANKYGKDFNRLYNEWDDKHFCVHPVKLSGWKV